jgi:hypothetical protein
LWVSNPNSQQFSEIPFEWKGSYLFLTEIAFTSPEYRDFISGCSALRVIANVLSNKPAFDYSGVEILGRWDNRPLTAKLLTLGALPLGECEIETLYSIKWMTNEQYDPDAPQGGRVNDILGYPIFICEL